jgi:hypothetical protein
MHHVYHEWPSGPRIPSTSLVTTRSASRPSLGARITLDVSDGASAVHVPYHRRTDRRVSGHDGQCRFRPRPHRTAPPARAPGWPRVRVISAVRRVAHRAGRQRHAGWSETAASQESSSKPAPSLTTADRPMRASGEMPSRRSHVALWGRLMRRVARDCLLWEQACLVCVLADRCR